MCSGSQWCSREGGEGLMVQSHRIHDSEKLPQPQRQPLSLFSGLSWTMSHDSVTLMWPAHGITALQNISPYFTQTLIVGSYLQNTLKANISTIYFFFSGNCFPAIKAQVFRQLHFAGFSRNLSSSLPVPISACHPNSNVKKIHSLIKLILPHEGPLQSQTI